MSDYTGFSSKVSEQSGNYLAFHAEVPHEDGVTITAKITKTSTLDTDGIAVFRIADKTKKLMVTASKEGYDSVTKEFDLSGLTLAEQTQEAGSGAGEVSGGGADLDSLLP